MDLRNIYDWLASNYLVEKVGAKGLENAHSVDKELELNMATVPLPQTQRSGPESEAQEWTIEIHGEASKELARVMSLTGHSMERILAIAISIVGLIVDARQIGNRVFTVTRGGRFLKEIFIPENPS